MNALTEAEKEDLLPGMPTWHLSEHLRFCKA